MYTRFGNAHGFKVEVLDYQAGQAGIKSVTLSFEGHAYGLLIKEGVHRVWYGSPFDSAKRRLPSRQLKSPELDDTV